MSIAFASSLTGSVVFDVVLVVALAVAAAVFFYRRPRVGLSRPQRITLTTLRALALALGLSLMLRPVSVLPPSTPTDAVVPLLVDVSQSMRIADADGLSRIAKADAIAQFDLAPALSRNYRVPMFGIGDGVVEADAGIQLQPLSTKSNLAGAIAQIRDRFRGQRLAGIVLLSDGADTEVSASRQQLDVDDASVPVFAVGVGSLSGLHDREVTDIAAAEPRLADASVDIRVSSSTVGFGRAPYEVRLLANGTTMQTRRVTPATDDSPDHVTFTVVPDPSQDVVYTAEVPVAPGETIAENNSRSVLVGAAGRKRRLLLIAGAPGFEHSFMTRAWAADVGLEVDAVVRKGKNAEGRDTFVIQAAHDRTQALAAGFPTRREDLYPYDALIIANVEGTFFTREQLAMIAGFVSERGGGLLVTGSRSLARGGLLGTPLEPVLPVELDERSGAVAHAPGAAERLAPNQLAVTAEGATHPIMRLGASGEETRMRWAALPSLAASTPLGPPRAGASVLAVVAAQDGLVFPVVAVQKYGRGRSMIFGGEASWRWRMLAESTNRSHELFWRQAARWLSHASPDPVSVSTPEAIEPGDSVNVDVDVRNTAFEPVLDATVIVSTSVDGGQPQQLAIHRGHAPGQFSAGFVPERRGIYRIHAEASRRAVTLSGDRTVFVGGGNREFADPRLNEPFLQRLADATGGRYVRASDARRVLSWLDDASRQTRVQPKQDAWDRARLFVAIVLLLCSEWTLRRRWGLR